MGRYDKDVSNLSVCSEKDVPDISKCDVSDMSVCDKCQKISECPRYERMFLVKLNATLRAWERETFFWEDYGW